MISKYPQIISKDSTVDGKDGEIRILEHHITEHQNVSRLFQKLSSISEILDRKREKHLILNLNFFTFSI